jgi:hypothetical protein
MKNLILSSLIVLISFVTNAQNSYLFSVHSGLGNPLKTNLRVTENIPNNATASYKGLPTLGVMATTKINDKLSIGFDFMYGTATVDFNRVDTTFSNGQWNYVTNSYEITKRRLRTQFRFNRHFGSNANMDQYVGFGIGGNKRWRKEYVNDTLTTSETTDSAIPFSMRLCYGFQYYPTYNLGIGGEIGLGGPLLQVAITYKL